MSHIGYSIRRSTGGDPVKAERRRCPAWLRASLTAALLAMPALPLMADAPGVTVHTVHDFNGNDGYYPTGLVQGADGSLYGTTQYGGASGDGDVFKVNADGSGFQDLHDFNGADGYSPTGLVQGADGSLYGTTQDGGAHGEGTVFKVNANGSGFQDLHDFNGNDGYYPTGLVQGADGSLYGTTQDGGAHGEGTVFKVNANGSGFQDLHDFNGSDGYYPTGLVRGADGISLYGTTQRGGAHGEGTVFKVNANGSGFQDLHDFNGSDGYYPTGLVQGADGSLYGATQYGGAGSEGTVFKVNADGSGFQDLHDFNGNDGAMPGGNGMMMGPGGGSAGGSLLLLGGVLYGTTSEGGANWDGTVFKVNADGSGFQDLHDFNGNNGYSPFLSLVQGADGSLYGTTQDGGANWDGTVFCVTIGPATTASLSGPQGANGWYTGDVSVTLSANDISAPITHTYYSIDGGTAQAYTTPFVVSGDLAHTVTFHSEDAHGNIEQDETQAVNIDGTLPTLTFGAPDHAANANGWNNTSVSIPYTTADPTSGVFTPGTSGSLSFSAEGANQTQTVTVTDVAGNHQDFTTPGVSIDLTAPVTTGALSGTQAQNGDYTGPVTVTLTPTDALSGVASTVYSIDGGTDQPYAQAFTVSGDGAHAITFHSVDVAGNAENAQTLTINADATAPSTTASLSGPQGAHGWYTGDVSVTLAATDAASGVAATYYTVDGGAPQTYATPFVVSGDLAHAITFWSVDTDGNAETAHAQAVNIDGTAPTLTFGTPSPAANAAGWNNTDVGVPFTTADATSGVDTAAPGSPVTLSGEGAALSQSVTVTDVAGNSAAFLSPVVKIDRTKPVTTAATQSGSAGPQVTLTPMDSLSGVASTVYAIDGGQPQPYTSPFTVSGNGDHVVTFHSVDNAGNAEDEETTRFTVNVAAPSTTASLSGPQGANGWYTGDVTVTLTPTAGAVGIAGTFYTVDDGAQQAYTAPFVVSGDKIHTVTFWSVDAAGNSEAHNQQPVKIDGTAPATAATPSGTPGRDGLYAGPVTVALSASDALSGVASTTYSVDGGAAQAYTGPLTVSGAGDHTVAFSSTDVAGNAEQSQTLSLSVAAPVPPVLHTFQPGLQMLSVTEDYGSADTAFSLPVSRVAFWSPQMVQYTLQGGGDPLHPGQGYWVRFAQATDLYDTGTKTPTGRPFTVSLQQGWNMIGDPFPSGVSLGGVTVTNGSGKSFSVKDANLAGLLSVTLYSYPAGSSAYQTTGADGTLAPYLGYWVYAFQSCSLSLPAPAAP